MSTHVHAQIKQPSAQAPSFMPSNKGLVQRKCADDECRQKKLTLQCYSTNKEEPSTVPPIVHEVLRSPGQPLDSTTRAFMEPRFGHDFSKVRVHTDVKAAESARAVDAHAYTATRNIVFGAGQFMPATTKGRVLLAHELTHVVQQQRGGYRSEGVIQRWNASDHERLTEEETTKLMTDYPNFKMDPKALTSLSKHSSDMDFKIEELWFNVGSVGRKVPVASIIFGRPGQSISEYYERHPYNARNHGEGGLYKVSEEKEAARENIVQQELYESQARKAYETKPQEKEVVLSILGDALHIAQDRGAHREGAKGLGHDNPLVDPDSPSSNSTGYDKAKRNTEIVLLKASDFLRRALQKDLFEARHPAEVRTIQRSSVAMETNLPDSKFSVNSLDDSYEKEADKVADAVMKMPGLHEIEHNIQMPLLPCLSMVQTDHIIQREVSTPLEGYVPKVEEDKAAEFKIGDVQVVVDHDTTTTDKKMKNRAQTSYIIDKYQTPRYKYNKANQVTEIQGPLPKFKIKIQTVYGPGATANSKSGFGKGTTEGDIKAGKTSLGYHEGSHGTDFLKYLKDNPPPKFEGKVGMKVSDYKKAEKKYLKERQEYDNKMKKNTENLTDCVGKKADFCRE